MSQEYSTTVQPPQVLTLSSSPCPANDHISSPVAWRVPFQKPQLVRKTQVSKVGSRVAGWGWESNSRETIIQRSNSLDPSRFILTLCSHFDPWREGWRPTLSNRDGVSPAKCSMKVWECFMSEANKDKWGQASSFPFLGTPWEGSPTDHRCTNSHRTRE